jgi:hypothetical protein
LIGYAFDFGGNKADIIATNGPASRKIEVKGTTKDFEYFGEKDIHADYLMWFDFKNLREQDATDSFDLYILPNPNLYFDKPLKILISRLKQKAGNNLISKPYSTSTLLGQVVSGASKGKNDTL